MPSVTLPIRIRPNRARVLCWALAWVALCIPAAQFCLHPDSPVAVLLLKPQLSLESAGAALVLAVAALSLLLTAGCILAALPRAPFLYLELDEQAVTERIFWQVKQRALRDVDSWAMRERVEIFARRYVRIPLRFFSVTPLPQGRDPQRARRQPQHLLEIHAEFFLPLFGGKAMFAQTLADCLTAAVTGTKQSQRPVSIDISADLFAQTFELRPHGPRPFPSQTESDAGSKRKPARLPGRYPTNQHRAEYWSSQAIQSAKASDDNPYTDYASERAEFYRQMAKRDRKRIARERKKKSRDR